MTRLIVASVAALAVAAPAEAGRFAVGVEPGTPVEAVAAAVEEAAGLRADRTLSGLGAVVVETSSPERLRSLAGVAYVERLDTAARRPAFAPNDPLAPRQWHLDAVRAFEFWPEPPPLAGPRVAVVDSGVDGTHPDLVGRVAAHRSFVGGSALTDQQGHGTFVAGLIAGTTNNAQGVAGIAFPSQLLVAKVVARNRMVPLEAEAQAIRWAVDSGARVINLSLGGLRDPRDAHRDTYSPLEAAAVRYAIARGVVVVAAVGNSDQAPTMPWPWASYPAALPHVIGVGALSRDNSVPAFSNRDPIYVDVAAPGNDLISTVPRALTSARPSCPDQGYSSCAEDELRRGEGTSFAAPQVAAAAALLLSVRPGLKRDQVTNLLTRTADDVAPANGCARCAPGRDSHTGWGRLNVARALTGSAAPPAPDRFETNDDAAGEAYRLWGRRRMVEATVDFWNDQVDVYGVFLRRGQRLNASLDGPYRADSTLVLWSPAARRLEQFSLRTLRQRLAHSSKRGWRQKLAYRARATGWHYLQVKVVSARSGPYKLAFAKR